MADNDDFVSTSASTAIESAPADTSTAMPKSAPLKDEGETHEDSETLDNGTDDQETSENDESQDDQAQEDIEAQTKPRKKGGFEKRIERFQKQLSAKDQELAALRAQLEGKSQAKPTEEKPQQVSATSEGEPNADDFDTNAEYIRAYTKWELKAAKESQAKELEQQKFQERAHKIQSEYNTKVTEFRKIAPDFDDVIEDFKVKYGGFNASPAIVEALQTSDLGPQIFYEVIKTPGEYERLGQLSEAQIIREIGKIEARLSRSSEETKPKITTSKAPAPVKPIGSTSGTVRKSLDDMNVDEFFEKRNAQTRRK